MLSIPTKWRRNATAIDTVEIMTSLDMKYLDHKLDKLAWREPILIPAHLTRLLNKQVIHMT